MSSGGFRRVFRDLTGNDPFPWQEELYKRFTGAAADGIPLTACIPTGLGKTSVIAVWLLALAHGARVPRRLVYVVNRRTVVDQTTNEVERLRTSIADNTNLSDLRASLRNLCATASDNEPPLAISTLRGQFADNRQWSADPSRPAVVCGTVDMIGSRFPASASTFAATIAPTMYAVACPRPFAWLLSAIAILTVGGF